MVLVVPIDLMWNFESVWEMGVVVVDTVAVKRMVLDVATAVIADSIVIVAAAVVVVVVDVGMIDRIEVVVEFVLDSIVAVRMIVDRIEMIVFVNVMRMRT